MQEKVTILVVESDPSVRFALGRVSLGPDVKLRYQEAAAFLADDQTYAAVLADDSVLVQVEDKSLLALMTERLACPVILMTAGGNRRIQAFAREAGAFSVLFKPFNAAELRRHLSTALGAGRIVVPGTTLLEGIQGTKPISEYRGGQLGGQIASEQAFDHLFTELERRQPLDEGLDAFDVVERHLVRRALFACDGNQSQASRFLGITRNTLRKRVHKYGFASLLTGDDQTSDDGEK